MKFPSFIPMDESKRKKREITGLILELFVWGYFFIFLGKIFVFSILFPIIENFAYDDTPSEWALNFIQSIDFDSRYFEFPWSWFFILFGMGAVVGFFVSLKCKGFGSWIASLSKLQVTNPEDSIKLQNHWKLARIEAYLLVFVTLVTGMVLINVSLLKILQIDGLLGAGRLTLQLACGVPGVGETAGSFSIYEGLQWILNIFLKIHNAVFANQVELFNIQCVPNDLTYFSKALSKLAESIYLAFIATFFSVPVAFALSFFASRNLTRHSFFMRSFYILIRSYMNITRSIEPLIWAILFSVWIGIGPFAGAMALMVHSISSLVKQYSEAVESVDEGPLEALQVTGANRISVVWYAVVPQVVLPFLAFTIYRWDINVRMATVIGLVGGGGIGSILIQEQMLARWTQVGSLAFLIFLVVWGMDFLSARIREAIQ
ncbi:phosphonate ABC transporter, permease protein PhnE [Silvanigrella aquatica]|uniref:Phosphonate ABC transporter, permease protein PhnE n=1 Tax=Silvanigrella aquatica TaxID=1915309 RepID=A0A1L4CZI8_9BACT|nr:phosphonate ABC transporter, permease protein PhnE [Silvanigrella aquatica]APJ03358.1 phosphonate ABC transporter, permease protein PhnE [Silvanigrella aquatica]